MKLSRYEQEVVINFNADENEATVYTANPVWMRKMDKLCKEFPKVIRLKTWTEVSKMYVLPKNLVRIGKPRTLSEAHQIESELRLAFTGVTKQSIRLRK